MNRMARGHSASAPHAKHWLQIAVGLLVLVGVAQQAPFIARGDYPLVKLHLALKMGRGLGLEPYGPSFDEEHGFGFRNRRNQRSLLGNHAEWRLAIRHFCRSTDAVLAAFSAPHPSGRRAADNISELLAQLCWTPAGVLNARSNWLTEVVHPKSTGKRDGEAMNTRAPRFVSTKANPLQVTRPTSAHTF